MARQQVAQERLSGSAPSQTPKGKLFIKTFGCQMNEYDSEKVAALLTSLDPAESLEDADVVFVNTCSVREKGEHKLYSLLGSLRELKRNKPELVVGVGGCVAQQDGNMIIRRSPVVDFVVGTHNLSLVPSLVNAAQNGLSRQVAIDYRDEWEDLPDTFLPGAGHQADRFGSVRALIAIQRGCNKCCSFCVVPTTRGREVSRSAEEILREIRTKVRLGAKEIMLLGQTVNSYGRDLTPRYPFERLIAEIANISGVHRIRFTSPHPADVRPEFIKLYREIPQLAPHIHLPLQSGSDRLLKLMNRNYRKARYLEIVDQLRAEVPQIAITTDIIVGFPTETESDFMETMDLLRAVRYSLCYSFRYSRRPNTTAIDAFSSEEEILDETSRRRLSQLQELQDEISLGINKEKIGLPFEVLVEERPKHISSLMRGRIPQNTLVEVDGQVSPGDVVKVIITHASPYGMRGQLVKDG